MLWIHTPVPAGEAEDLSKRAGVGPRGGGAPRARGGTATRRSPSSSFAPDLSRLDDPFLVGNLVPAVARLRAAILGRERVIVLGDYDVDGVSSTALLVSVLRRFGLDPRFVVPRRSEDGYGLSRSAIDRALETGRPALFIALDCGTNSHEEIGVPDGAGDRRPRRGPPPLQGPLASAGPPGQPPRRGSAGRVLAGALAVPVHGGPRVQADARPPQAAQEREPPGRRAHQAEGLPRPGRDGHHRRPGPAPRREPDTREETA